MNVDKTSYLINHIDKSIYDAELLKSGANPMVFNLEGMSGTKTRHFFNNLMSFRIDGKLKYLEVGSWRGSTFCAAISNNEIEATSIDNFTEYANTSYFNDALPSRLAFHRNVHHIMEKSKYRSNLTFIDQDAFTIDVNRLGRFDVYFYDGEHSFKSQYGAYSYFYPCFDDICIVITDDYSIDPLIENAPREATQKAFKDLNFKVLKDWYLFGGNETQEKAWQEWWNGVYVAVIQKG